MLYFSAMAFFFTLHTAGPFLPRFFFLCSPVPPYPCAVRLPKVGLPWWRFPVSASHCNCKSVPNRWRPLMHAPNLVLHTLHGPTYMLCMPCLNNKLTLAEENVNARTLSSIFTLSLVTHRFQSRPMLSCTYSSSGLHTSFVAALLRRGQCCRRLIQSVENIN